MVTQIRILVSIDLRLRALSVAPGFGQSRSLPICFAQFAPRGALLAGNRDFSYLGRGLRPGSPWGKSVMPSNCFHGPRSAPGRLHIDSNPAGLRSQNIRYFVATVRGTSSGHSRHRVLLAWAWSTFFFGAVPSIRPARNVVSTGFNILTVPIARPSIHKHPNVV